MCIPHICHHRHHRRWCTFFKPAYLFKQSTRKRQQILNTKCNKYTSQCQRHQSRQPKTQVRQPKHHVRQTKHQVRQLKHRLCNLNQKSMTKKQILVYAVLSRGNFCREFTHFFGVPFTGLKNMVAYQK